MFATIQELKDRVRLVLKIKSKALEAKGYNKTPDEIFEDLSLNKWSKSQDLHLYDIVDDILKYEIKK